MALRASAGPLPSRSRPLVAATAGRSPWRERTPVGRGSAGQQRRRARVEAAHVGPVPEQPQQHLGALTDLDRFAVHRASTSPGMSVATRRTASVGGGVRPSRTWRGCRTSTTSRTPSHASHGSIGPGSPQRLLEVPHVHRGLVHLAPPPEPGGRVVAVERPGGGVGRCRARGPRGGARRGRRTTRRGRGARRRRRLGAEVRVAGHDGVRGPLVHTTQVRDEVAHRPARAVGDRGVEAGAGSASRTSSANRSVRRRELGEPVGSRVVHGLRVAGPGRPPPGAPRRRTRRRAG